MKTFRSNLSRLIKQIEEQLPEDNDIYGYAGIDRQVLLDAVNLAYNLSTEIEERNDSTRFEVINLKRFGSETYKKLKKFWELKDEERKKTDFDKFLSNLSGLIEKTKLVYFIVNKNGLRDDVELASLKAKIDQYSIRLEELNTLLTQFEDDTSSLQSIAQEITEKHQSISSLETQIESTNEKVKECFEYLTSVNTKVEGWDDEIQNCSTEFSTLSSQMSTMKTESSILKDTLEKHVTKGESSSKTLEKNEEKNKLLLQEIDKTLGDANRLGMSASFRERANELKKTQIIWAILFLVATIGLSLILFPLLKPMFVSGKFEWQGILARITLVSPLIWLSWFAVKQYGYTTKLKEDYAYKYAFAMAYEGYKKATSEVNRKLQGDLLQKLLLNISLSPMRLYDKKYSHTSPIHELFDSFLNKHPDIAAKFTDYVNFEMKNKPQVVSKTTSEQGASE